MKDLIVRIILIVILLSLYVAMNSGVSELLLQQQGMNIAMNQGRSMWVGLGRWMSHINWMLLLQKRATISGKPDEAIASALHRRYDATTDQDPFLVMAYEHGGVELATIGQPESGLQLLDKGIKVMGDTNWKLPSYAAQIVSQYCKDDADKENKVQAYLEQAKKVEGHPFYIESALVRIKCKDIKDDPVAMAKLWQEVGSRTAGNVERPAGMPGVVPPEAGMYGEYGDRYSQQACDKVVGILRNVREQADKATDAAQKDALNKQAAEIVEIIKVMKGAQNACSYCFAEYKAGDKFCPNCGRGVEVFGVCEKCGEVLGPNVKFCPKCGATAPAPQVRQPMPAMAAPKANP